MTTNTTASSGTDLDLENLVSEAVGILQYSMFEYVETGERAFEIGRQLAEAFAARRAYPQPVAVDVQARAHRISFAHEVGGPWRLDLNGIAISRHRKKADLEQAVKDLHRALTQHPSAAPSAQIADRAGDELPKMPKPWAERRADYPKDEQPHSDYLIEQEMKEWREWGKKVSQRATQPPTAPVLARYNMDPTAVPERDDQHGEWVRFSDIAAQQAGTCQPKTPQNTPNGPQSDSLATPTCQGSAQQADAWFYECRQFGDEEVWSEFFSREKPKSAEWLRNIRPMVYGDKTAALNHVAAPVPVAVADGRDAVLEEAASICEAQEGLDKGDWAIAKGCAMAIRALKATSSAAILMNWSEE